MCIKYGCYDILFIHVFILPLTEFFLELLLKCFRPMSNLNETITKMFVNSLTSAYIRRVI